jgi:hypothetical protein
VTKHLQTIAFVVALSVALGVVGIGAQNPPPAPPQVGVPPPQPPGVKGPVTPLQVQVVISRYQGEKKIGSVPYSLAVNAAVMPFGTPARPAQLKMGSMVPIMSPAAPGVKPAGDAPPAANTTAFNHQNFNYQNIGTQIDCSAAPSSDGRFELNISIEDSSIYLDNQVVKGVSKGNEPPILRSFRSRNDLILRDGQSIQFTAATDRISGEIIKVDITLNVLK